MSERVDAVIGKIQARGHAYASEVVRRLASVAGAGVTLDEQDVSQAFVAGFAAGMETADAAHLRARTSYPARRRRGRVRK